MKATQMALLPPQTLTELQEKVVAHFAVLTPQEQKVATFIVENPSMVALFSMRKLAKTAEVTSYTVIRLFKKFGFSNFDDVKNLASRALVLDPLKQVENSRDALRDDAEFSNSMLSTQLNLVLGAAKSPTRDELDRLAKILMRAKINYVIGFRASFALAQHFHYCGQHAHKNMLLVSGLSGQSTDQMAEIGSGDVVFALSFKPYAQMTIKLCTFAKNRGARIVAITDSKLSPLYRLADDSIFVPAKGTSYFNSLVGPILVLERLLVRMHALNANATERLNKYRNFHRFIDRNTST